MTLRQALDNGWGSAVCRWQEDGVVLVDMVGEQGYRIEALNLGIAGPRRHHAITVGSWEDVLATVAAPPYACPLDDGWEFQ